MGKFFEKRRKLIAFFVVQAAALVALMSGHLESADYSSLVAWTFGAFGASNAGEHAFSSTSPLRVRESHKQVESL